MIIMLSAYINLYVLIGTNVAYKKSVWMGHRQGGKYHPSKSVDGNLNTVAISKRQKSPSWKVSLGGQYLINGVEIYNRKDCCGKISMRTMLCVM